jgi:hypothetical protein
MSITAANCPSPADASLRGPGGPGGPGGVLDKLSLVSIEAFPAASLSGISIVVYPCEIAVTVA